MESKVCYGAQEVNGSNKETLAKQYEVLNYIVNIVLLILFSPDYITFTLW